MEESEQREYYEIITGCWKILKQATSENLKNIEIRQKWVNVIVNFEKQHYGKPTQSFAVAQCLAARREIEKLAGPSDPDTAEDAWKIYRKAIERGTYYSEVEWNNLPDAIKDVITTSGELKEDAARTPEYIDQVKHNYFIGRYNTVKKRKEAQNDQKAVSSKD